MLTADHAKWTITLILVVAGAHRVGAADIPAGHDAPTSHDYAVKEKAFLTRTILQPYREHRDSGRVEPSKDDPIEAFLELWIDHTVQGYNAQNNDSLEYRGKQIADDGCTESIFCYCYGRLLRVQRKLPESAKYLKLAHNHLEGSPYDVSYRCWAASQLMTVLRDLQRNDDAALLEMPTYDSLVATIETGPYRPDEQRLLYQHIEWFLDSYSIESLQKLVDEIYGNASVDLWLQHLIAGKLEIRLAWQARGSGWATQVTDQGWAAFKEHLGKAYEHLNSAWELNKEAPEPPTAIIAVAMAGETPSEETPRVWFDRAVAAQMDYIPAYSAMQNTLLPRWGGSHEAMYLFGRECLNTKRFDTYVPYEFLAVLQYMFFDMGSDFDIIRSPGVYEDLIALADGYIAEQSRDWSRHWYRSLKIAVAARCGKWDDAFRYLHALDSQSDAEAFTRVGLSRDLTIGEIYARAGKFSEQTAEAERLFDKEQFDEAEAKFGGLLKLFDDKSPQAAYIGKRLANVRFNRLFSHGDWTPIVADRQLSQWRKNHGNWTADEQGRLVGQAQSDGLVLIADKPLGTRFEVRGKADIVSGPRDDAFNVSIFFGRETGDMRSSFTFSKREQSAAVLSSGEPVEKKAVAVGESNSFRVQRWDDKLSAFLNEKPVLSGVKIETFGNPAGEVLAIGSKCWGHGPTIRFEGIEVRKLPEEPSDGSQGAKESKAESGESVETAGTAEDEKSEAHKKESAAEKVEKAE